MLDPEYAESYGAKQRRKRGGGFGGNAGGGLGGGGGARGRRRRPPRAETCTARLASAGSTTAPLRWAAEAGRRLPFARVMQERTLLTRTHGGALSLFSSGAERDVSRIIDP